MRFRLRSLVIATIFLPPLLAWGWRFVEAAMTPHEPDYQCGHSSVNNVDWKKATQEVKDLGTLTVQLKSDDAP
jgi:hypothetical protein